MHVNVLALFLVLIIIGVVIWAVTVYLPMDPAIKRLIQIVGIVIAIIYVLSAFGLFHGASNIDVPKAG